MSYIPCAIALRHSFNAEVIALKSGEKYSGYVPPVEMAYGVAMGEFHTPYYPIGKPLPPEPPEPPKPPKPKDPRIVFGWALKAFYD